MSRLLITSDSRCLSEAWCSPPSPHPFALKISDNPDPFDILGRFRGVHARSVGLSSGSSGFVKSITLCNGSATVLQVKDGGGDLLECRLGGFAGSGGEGGEEAVWKGPWCG
jgi:hypothetical protein